VGAGINWEGDLVSGSNNSHIATLVECHTRYVMLAKVNGKDTETVINALIKRAHKLPKELYHSLTWDRGNEMADHSFTMATYTTYIRCTSVIHKAHGNAVRTRTLMACCDNASGREQTYRGTRRRNSMRWHDSSTNDHEKRSTTKHRPNDSTFVLRPPVECADHTCSMSPYIQALWMEARSGRLGRPFMVGPKV